jgi:hypothetical protein
MADNSADDNEDLTSQATPTTPGAKWDPDQAIENLKMERSVRPSESEEEVTKRIFKENAPIVAQSLVQVAMHSPSESMRVQAGKYVIDRVLGKIGDDNKGDDDPIRTFIESMMTEVETHANQG